MDGKLINLLIKLLSNMFNDKITGLLRHILTFVGGYLVTAGIIDEQMLTEVVGAIITLVGFVWSWTSKKETEE
jgi:hypothetical protein